MHGILLLDKPKGLGSNEVLQRVKRLFKARKAGHTGSLDRLASGLLPLCFGEATKLSSFLLNADKRYVARFRLGTTTTTGDAEGETVQTRPLGTLPIEQIRATLAEFLGEITQVPPMYSALKHKGQRLYKLAHQGVVVEREPRCVTIHELVLLDWSEPCLEVEVLCTKGTYIRTLAEDIGERLGCGAFVEELRRIASGPFHIEDAVTPEELRSRVEARPTAVEEFLLPMETALLDFPQVSVSETVAHYVRHGQAVLVPHAPTHGWVRIFAGNDTFLGVGEVLDDGRIAPRRLVNYSA